MKGVSEKEQIKILTMAFDESYDGLHILNAAGETLYINKACTRIEGISKAHAMSKNIRELVEDGTYSESVTLMVIENKKQTTIIQTTKNGNQVLVTGTPIFGEDGEIDKIIVNSRDITELNQLKKELSYKGELTRKYERELELLRMEATSHEEFVTKSVAMQKLTRLALNVAKVDSTVLITGASGVGKGILAKLIHNNSNRSLGPFIKIDCSVIPETLFESELYGYEKGAFTGAERTGKVGLLELANGGTLFLDEIGEIPMSAQAKLLSAIQDKEITAVGGKTKKQLDIRIIAATNMDLEKMMKHKSFREDLYYRLNVVPIHIPPLKERKDDILPLIMLVTERINNIYKWEKSFSPEALTHLIEYNWPGNVRELENLIERTMVSVSKDVLTPEDLPELKKPTLQDVDENSKATYKYKLAAYDYALLLDVITREGSIPKASNIIGIDATTIRRKIKRYKTQLNQGENARVQMQICPAKGKTYSSISILMI